MSEETKVEYRGQCDAWWDARVNRAVDWPKHLKPGAPELVPQVMRCVMEAGHDPLLDLKAGHNFGGLGPYTPGMPGWKAQQRALGLPDVVVPTCVKWEGHDFPNGATCRKCETYWIEQRSALFAANPWSWTPPAEPGPEVRRVRPVERYPGDNGIKYDREPDNSGWRLVMMGRRGEVIEWLQVLAGAGSIYGGRQLIDATSELAEEGRGR